MNDLDTVAGRTRIAFEDSHVIQNMESSAGCLAQAGATRGKAPVPPSRLEAGHTRVRNRRDAGSDRGPGARCSLPRSSCRPSWATPPANGRRLPVLRPGYHGRHHRGARLAGPPRPPCRRDLRVGRRGRWPPGWWPRHPRTRGMPSSCCPGSSAWAWWWHGLRPGLGFLRGRHPCIPRCRRIWVPDDRARDRSRARCGRPFGCRQ